MTDEAGASPIDTASYVIDAGSDVESTSDSATDAERLLHDSHGFRAAAATVTARLIHQYGTHQLDRIEDAVQDAFVAAARTWSVSGTPRAPLAWLGTVAQRRYLDHARSSRRLVFDADAGRDVAAGGIDTGLAEPIADEELRLLFLCCHPALSSESRVALTLKCAAQFSVEEIARLLRADPRAVAQRLVRAKRTLQDRRATFLLPTPTELPDRLQDVLAVCYAMFAEGHLASGSEALLRPDLCREAMRLVSLLSSWTPTATPDTHALLALLCFTAARFPTREATDSDGIVAVPLSQQDRTRWLQPLIARGMHALSEAAAGDRFTRYHAEAEIAALHSMAPAWERTDWPAIVNAYDRLLVVAPTDSARLSRWTAMAEAGQAEHALDEMQRYAAQSSPAIVERADWHATLARLFTATRRVPDALAAYDRALSYTAPSAVHRFWAAQRDQLAPHS